MILVDTSVWADHIRTTDRDMARLLALGGILTHPFVIEELACGHLPDRRAFLALMHKLPQAPVASHHDMLMTSTQNKLFGTGLGAVDVHLIASAMLAGAKIWSRDKALAREAARLNVAV